MPRSLLVRIASAFDHATAARGTAYLHRGRVQDLVVHGRTAEARVRGTRHTPYTVTVACPVSAPWQLRTSCSCPLGQTQVPCKARLRGRVLPRSARGRSGRRGCDLGPRAARSGRGAPVAGVARGRDGAGRDASNRRPLLRLRQAACHPALIDGRYARAASAKLDTLVEHLAEATETGHKALVFSQFTSFLALLRARLDASGVRYEYLDGHTCDRKEAVTRFNTDASRKVFLISLKAGGTGLNLVSADYVYLLDPWWNPAVEAQAIDRTHRPGQTRPVLAYRLIAQNTVEDKILELQAGKRALAAGIFADDGGGLSGLSAADLELLFS